ncbi:MAG: hypothetical protein ACHREM_07955 [Polyangiales bacterium]
MRIWTRKDVMIFLSGVAWGVERREFLHASSSVIALCAGVFVACGGDLSAPIVSVDSAIGGVDATLDQDVGGICTCSAGYPGFRCPDGPNQPFLGMACQPEGACLAYYGPCGLGVVDDCTPTECGPVPDPAHELCTDLKLAGTVCFREATGACTWTVTGCFDAGAD